MSLSTNLSKKLKILFINNEFPPIGGGGGILTYYLAKNLASLGHKITVLTSTYRNLPKEEMVDGFKIIRVSSLRRKKDFSNYIELSSFALSSCLYSLIFVKSFKPDIIHAFFSVPAGAVAFLINKIYKIPYAVYLGGSDVPGANPIRHKKIYPFVTPIIKTVLKNACFISACSDRLINLLKKTLPEVRVKKIPNGVDTSVFTPPKKKPKIPPVIILGVGRMTPRKGFQNLIKAVSILKEKKVLPFKVILIGSGEYKDFLEREVSKNGLKSIIEFVDSVPYSKLREYYKKAHIFSLPSLAEGMPLAMLEALSCGNAILTTKVAGNEELVKEGLNGYLCKPNDYICLAKRLQDMLSSPKKLGKMGEESRKIALNYDWKKLTQKYLHYYFQMLKR